MVGIGSLVAAALLSRCARAPDLLQFLRGS
jgi:hypothetical protein